MFLSNKTILENMTHTDRVDLLNSMWLLLMDKAIKSDNSHASTHLRELGKSVLKARDMYKASLTLLMPTPTEEETALMNGAQWISGLKKYRDRTNCMLLDAKWMCDSIRGM
jgi:hypothetical protein